MYNIFWAVKRRYGPLCQEVHARNGDRDVEQLEAKVDILELMEQMFEYRTKLGLPWAVFLWFRDFIKLQGVDFIKSKRVFFAFSEKFFENFITGSLSRRFVQTVEKVWVRTTYSCYRLSLFMSGSFRKENLDFKIQKQTQLHSMYYSKK